jgi:hypothetical protein
MIAQEAAESYQAPIHDAASSADATMLRRALENGVSPDAVDRFGNTPLLLLCCRNLKRSGDYVACFELLHEAGANLEATDSAGHTPLHEAADSGCLELLSLLIQSGVNVDTSSDGYTALHFAARGHHELAGSEYVCCVDALLAAGASVSARTESAQYGPDGGLTALTIAIHRGNRRAWPSLLRAGAEFPGPPLGHHQNFSDPYILRVKNAGGFKKYAQNHLAAMTKLFVANGRRLPPEVVRQIMKFWLHLGYY